jgi:phospholipid transport system substrate-binding protein
MNGAGFMRRPTKWIAAGMYFCGCLILHAAARAGEPTETIRTSVDKVIEVLNDKTLKTQPELREQKVWDIASPLFDFEEMARRTLATHWRELTPEEQREFVDLFSRLLYRTYVGRIRDYTDEKVEFLEEEVDGPRAVVNTVLKGEGLQVRVDYRMLKEPSGWLIYDVVVEDVSLVNNYRTQFNQIILSSGYKALIQRLRTKQEDFDKELDLEKRESS